MKNINEDLYQVFEGLLMDENHEFDSDQEFIDQVAAGYIEKSRSSNLIPSSFECDLIEEVTEMVRDMLRKKTYGYFSLKDYQLAKKNQ